MAWYKYFISGKYLDRHNEFGDFRNEVLCQSKITSSEEVIDIEKELKRRFDYKKAIITNYILLDSEEEKMDNDKFLDLCKQTVVNYFNCGKDTSNADMYTGLTLDDVFVVWSCKTLQNNKALLSTTVPDGMYYELTYNGDKKELYMDAYKKWENICFEGVE